MTKIINDIDLEDEILKILNKFDLNDSKPTKVFGRHMLNLIMVTLCLVCFAFAGNHYYNTLQKITADELRAIKDGSKTVASCENKSLQKVYAELKKEYTFSRLDQIDKKKYTAIMKELNSRFCLKD